MPGCSHSKNRGFLAQVIFDTLCTRLFLVHLHRLERAHFGCTSLIRRVSVLFGDDREKLITSDTSWHVCGHVNVREFREGVFLKA